MKTCKSYAEIVAEGVTRERDRQRLLEDMAKARREGLVPKKVTVTKKGKTFQQTVYVRPGEEKKEGAKPSLTEQEKRSGYSPKKVFSQAAAAVHRLRAGDSGGASHVFHRVMTAKDREHFDKFLVETKNPLASQAGTTEQRFLAYAKEKVRKMGGVSEKMPAKGEKRQAGVQARRAVVPDIAKYVEESGLSESLKRSLQKELESTAVRVTQVKGDAAEIRHHMKGIYSDFMAKHGQRPEDVAGREHVKKEQAKIRAKREQAKKSDASLPAFSETLIGRDRQRMLDSIMTGTRDARSS